MGFTAAGSDHVKWTFGESFRQPDFASGDLTRCHKYGTVEFKNCTVQLPSEKQKEDFEKSSSNVQDRVQMDQDQREAVDKDSTQSHADKPMYMYINRLVGYPTSYR